MKQPYVSKDDDGSMTLEWIYPDCRVGICIDPNSRDCGWWAVTRETQLFGELPAGVDWQNFEFTIPNQLL